MGFRRFVPIVCVAVGGCALQPAATPPSDQAEVVIYRTGIPVGPDAEVAIYDGDQLIGSLARGCYLQLNLAPGVTKFFARMPGTDTLPYATTLVAGKQYYLMIYYRGRGMLGDFGLLPQDAASATSALLQLKESPLPGNGALPSAPQ